MAVEMLHERIYTILFVCGGVAQQKKKKKKKKKKILVK